MRRILRWPVMMALMVLLGADLAAQGGVLAQPGLVPAQIDIVQDPDNLALKQELDQDYTTLSALYEKVEPQEENYVQVYANKVVVVGSAEQAAALAAYGQLKPQADAYRSALAEYTAKLAQLRLIDTGGANPVVGAGAFVTNDDYQDALKKEQDLLKQQQLWQNKLAELKRWQQGLQTDTNEFAKIQEEAQIDYLHDMLMKIPAGETFEGFADLGIISKDDAAAMASGYDALKGLVSGAEGLDTSDSQEKLKKILEAQQSFRDSMTDQAMAKLKEANPKAFAWYENAGKTLEAGKELLVFAQQEDHSGEAWAKLGAQLVMVAVPLANYGVIVETIGEKKYTQSLVQEPLDSLNVAMHGNFSAQRYLSGKLDPVNYALANVQNTIAKYQAAHPQSEW